MDDELIGLIYEAGAMPQRWPATLDRIATHFGSRGGLLFLPARAAQFVASPTLDDVMQEWIGGGWHHHVRISEDKILQPEPTFFTDTDCHSVADMARMPVYADFLRPRRLDVGVGTIVRGADDGRIAFTLEGFASHDAARTSVPALNRLRPHIARAVTLSARIVDDRLETAMRTLDAIGMPAAMLAGDGRLLAANAAFDGALDRFGGDGPRGLHLKRPGADDLLAQALARRRAGLVAGCTIPIGLPGDEAPAALHLLPIEGIAQDLFTSGATLAVIGQGSPNMAAGGTFLEMLFDLTVAEARLARALLGGAALPEISRDFGLSRETIRTQLKALFAKTGVKRQIDLVRLFDSLAPPGAGGATPRP